MDITSAAFWAALGSIILANILLSGDNAVVIALAARSLPPQQQKKAVFWGAGAAVILRIILTIFARSAAPLPPSAQWFAITNGTPSLPTRDLTRSTSACVSKVKRLNDTTHGML